MVLEVIVLDMECFKFWFIIILWFLGLIFIVVFDVWLCYDEKVIFVYLEGVDCWLVVEQSLENKEKVISYVVYCVMSEYYYIDKDCFVVFMWELGYDLEDELMDFLILVGIGNLVVKVVIEVCKGDGFNQYGEEEGFDGVFYFNYIGYEFVNFVDVSVDVNCWQFKYFFDGKGGKFVFGCLIFFWDKVELFVF